MQMTLYRGEMKSRPEIFIRICCIIMRIKKIHTARLNLEEDVTSHFMLAFLLPAAQMVLILFPFYGIIKQIEVIYQTEYMLGGKEYDENQNDCDKGPEPERTARRLRRMPDILPVCVQDFLYGGKPEL